MNEHEIVTVSVSQRHSSNQISYADVQDEAGRRTIQAFLDTAGQVRTSLLDTALGLDYILPGMLCSHSVVKRI